MFHCRPLLSARRFRPAPETSVLALLLLLLSELEFRATKSRSREIKRWNVFFLFFFHTRFFGATLTVSHARARLSSSDSINRGDFNLRALSARVRAFSIDYNIVIDIIFKRAYLSRFSLREKCTVTSKSFAIETEKEKIRRT